MRNHVLILSALVTFTGCTQRTETPAEPEPVQVAAPKVAEGTSYGEAIQGKDSITVGAILKAPQDFDGKTVLIDGAVKKACTKKGCWMELADSMEDSAAGCRVTFKDYGFFVPTDSAGALAKVEGTVGIKKVDAEHVAHLESEGAKFAEKLPDGSAHEVQIVATGVELRKAPGAKVEGTEG